MALSEGLEADDSTGRYPILPRSLGIVDERTGDLPESWTGSETLCPWITSVDHIIRRQLRYLLRKVLLLMIALYDFGTWFPSDEKWFNLLTARTDLSASHVISAVSVTKSDFEGFNHHTCIAEQSNSRPCVFISIHSVCAVLHLHSTLSRHPRLFHLLARHPPRPKLIQPLCYPFYLCPGRDSCDDTCTLLYSSLESLH